MEIPTPKWEDMTQEQILMWQAQAIKTIADRQAKLIEHITLKNQQYDEVTTVVKRCPTCQGHDKENTSKWLLSFMFMGASGIGAGIIKGIEMLSK